VLRDQITIIIPEHKRPEHLRRLLDYFLSFGLHIIVADSSPVKFKYLAEYDELITYRFFPGEDLAAKLNKVVYLIKTPYVVMCANDDFLVPKAIEEIIEFLELNPDYNSGQGVYTDFKFLNGKIFSSLRYKETTDIDLNSHLAMDRLFALQKKYFQYYYAVFRTETFEQVIKSVICDSESQIKNLCLLESYVSCFSAIDGKHIIMPIFYAARENMETSAATETDTIPEVIQKQKYRAQYRNYLNLLSSHLSNIDNIKYETAFEHVENSIKLYILQLYPNFFTIKGKLIFSIRGLLKRYGILKLIQQFRAKNEDITALPINISNSEELKVIEFYIKKYDFIYK